jgi:hypothetical protein
MGATTTSNMSQPIATYYEKRFLMRAQENFLRVKVKQLFGTAWLTLRLPTPLV